MFENIINKVKGVFRGMQEVTGIGEVKSVFDVRGVPAFREFYERGIYIWKYLYRGYYKEWHDVKAPTIANPGAQRTIERMSAAKALVQELASLVWSEQCTVAVSMLAPAAAPQDAGAPQEDKLQAFIDSVLASNNFTVKMQELIEQGFALGGAAVKTWYEPERTENGDPIDGQGKIRLGYCMADQFIPLSWDNADVSEGVFISRRAKGGYYYTTLEWHRWDGKSYIVTNELYRKDAKASAAESQNILGIRCPLDELYPNLSPITPVVGLERSLFSYWRTNIANNLDDNSPLGISLYANALSTLKALDICYDSFVREFILGRKRIIVPSTAVRVVTDPKTGKTCRYFDANDEIYEALNIDDSESLKIQDNSVEIREEEHISAINAFLGILSFQVGLSPGTLTFDRAEGLKTATEVISEKSKTYKTVTSHEIPIKAAIEKLVHNIIDVAVLYGVEHEGEKVERLVAGGYEISISFDDSIIQDRGTDIDEGIKLMAAEVESKLRFMTTRLGMTDEEAKKELAQIAAERRISGLTLDSLILDAGKPAAEPQEPQEPAPAEPQEE